MCTVRLQVPFDTPVHRGGGDGGGGGGSGGGGGGVGGGDALEGGGSRALGAFLKVCSDYNPRANLMSYALGRGCVPCVMQTLKCSLHLDGDWHKQNERCILIFLAQQAIQKHQKEWVLLAPGAIEEHEWRNRAVSLLCRLRDELKEGQGLLHASNWTSTLHDEVVPALSPPAQAAQPARIDFQ